MDSLEHFHVFLCRKTALLTVPEQPTPVQHSKTLRRFASDLWCVICKTNFLYERWPVKDGFCERHICKCGAPMSTVGQQLFRVHRYGSH
jgi:hypothetical protein